MVYEDFIRSIQYKSNREMEIEMRELTNTIKIFREGGDVIAAQYHDLIRQIYASEIKRRTRESFK